MAKREFIGTTYFYLYHDPLLPSYLFKDDMKVSVYTQGNFLESSKDSFC